jgi:hypothetical protein
MVCVTRDRGNAASSRPLCKFLQAGSPRRAVGEELLGALVERLPRTQSVRVLQVLLIAGVWTVMAVCCCLGSGLLVTRCLLASSLRVSYSIFVGSSCARAGRA